MPSTVKSLASKELCHPPSWLPDNTMYEVWMGSTAYGVAQDSSDMDIYGFAIPPKDVIFPHLTGYISGFGTPPTRFDQYQQHHIKDPSARGGRGTEYDISIYNIVKYFQLCMDNNPNMIDSLYVPQDCVLHITTVGQMVRDSREIFLHKGSWHKFRGYAYSQLAKMGGKSKDSKRYWMVEKYGYDLKFAYHIIRLILEVEMILVEHTIEMRRHSDLLKAIRNGEWTEEQVREWFSEKEKSLEELYHTSGLRYRPNEGSIKYLLVGCLEHHYGSLRDAVAIPQKVDQLVADIDAVLSRYR